MWRFLFDANGHNSPLLTQQPNKMIT